MTMTASSGEGRSYSDINMTPLIDVMLVLLVIFIITVPQHTHAVKIDNPAGPPPTESDQRDVVNLAIDFDGTMTWNSTPVNHTALLAYIGRAARQSAQPEVHITVDRFSRYEIVAQTLADLQRRGVKRIGVVNSGL